MRVLVETKYFEQLYMSGNKVARNKLGEVRNLYKKIIVSKLHREEK